MSLHPTLLQQHIKDFYINPAHAKNIYEKLLIQFFNENLIEKNLKYNKYAQDDTQFEENYKAILACKEYILVKFLFENKINKKLDVAFMLKNMQVVINPLAQQGVENIENMFGFIVNKSLDFHAIFEIKRHEGTLRKIKSKRINHYAALCQYLDPRTTVISEKYAESKIKQMIDNDGLFTLQTILKEKDFEIEILFINYALKENDLYGKF